MEGGYPAQGEFKEEEGPDWEFGVSRCKLLHSKWINNRVLSYSTENYIQPSGIKNNGKEY